eukprot:9432475-Heterocapsa_arctica.AAC.1
MGDRAAEASSTARKLDWKVLQSEAIPGVGFGCSGGGDGPGKGPAGHQQTQFPLYRCPWQGSGCQDR